MIFLEYAKNPVSTGSGITLTCKFAHIQHEVEFHATPIDTEQHGREVYDRALAGEFGPVVEYVPPTPAEIAARDNPPLRASKMAQAVEQATHWDMMGDPAQAASWRSYYRELYVLDQAPGWPLVEQWPTQPEVSLPA